MQEVLFRKEIMCATRFSTSWVAIWEWLNETPPNEAMQYGSAKKINVNFDDGWKNDAGFVSKPDIFVRKLSTRCMTKSMEPHLL